MTKNQQDKEIDIQSVLEDQPDLASSNPKTTREITPSELLEIATLPRTLKGSVFFNTCFDKTALKNLIAWFLDQYGQKVTVDLVETLKQVGFHQATQAGVSLGIDDLLIPPEKEYFISQAGLQKRTVIQSLQTGNVTSVEKSQRLIDTWNQTSETLRHSAVQNFRSTNPVNPVYMMAFSGARGNISQVRQLVGMRGLMADPQGAILEFPIQSNFREGLTVSEYLISCFGARKGLVDTALRTATSGYLTRRLVDAVQHVVIQISDCYTEKGLLLKGPKLEQRLLGRVLLTDVDLDDVLSLKKNTLITPPLAHRLAARSTEIWVRSPLTCETEKSVCQLCYGLDLGQGKLVSLGEAVGIIAAQSIGEPGTQLTMRTFHTGGVGVFSEQALKSFLAPFAGKVEFVDPLPGRFVRTPHGNVVYLLKHKTSNPTQPLLRLVSFSKEKVQYKIFHGEVPAGSLLWVKHGESVKPGHLLIQASRLETTSQEMPESSQPILSPLSGEVLFERMLVRYIKKRKVSKLQKKPLSSDKEIKPIVPVLFRLGKFWVFSSSLQYESQLAQAFFRKGDLVSPETPVQQYNVHFSVSGQVKRLGSEIVLGSTQVELNLRRLSYSQLGYFCKVQKEDNSSTVVFYTKNENQVSLTWYPSFLPFVQSGGYLFRLPCQKHETVSLNPGIAFQNSGFGAVTESESQRTKIKLQTPTDFTPSEFVSAASQVLSPTFRTQKEFNRLLSHLRSSGNEKSCFFVSSETQDVSEKGFFALESFKFKSHKGQRQSKFVKNSQALNWLRKTKFSTNFKKNSLTFSFKKQESSITSENSTSLNEIKLKKIQSILKESSSLKFIHSKAVWFCVPERSLFSKDSHKLRVLLEPGKFIDNSQFSNSFISVSFLDSTKIGIVKAKKRKPSFFSRQELLNRTHLFQNAFVPVGSDLSNDFLLESSRSLSDFSFYRKNKNELLFMLKGKQELRNLICFQKLLYFRSPETKLLKDEWVQLTTQKKPVEGLHSPLFTKQRKTRFQPFLKPLLQIQTVVPKKTGWFSSSQGLQIKIKFQSSHSISTTLNKPLSVNLSDTFFTKEFNFSNTQTPDSWESTHPKLQLFFSHKVELGTLETSPIQTFRNGWLLSEWNFTQAFRKSSKLGEFRALHHPEKKSQLCLSFLQNDDLESFLLPGLEIPKEVPTSFKFPTNHSNFLNSLKAEQSLIGTDIRSGYEFHSGWALPESGRIVKFTQNSVTVRKGIPFLASVRGLLHTRNSDLVEKNDLLVTLRSRRLQTEDIVQGIPKIEQLFEARETRGGKIIPNNMHMLLRRFFDLVIPRCERDEAVDMSLMYIHNFLVQTIRDAYSTQGVDIAEKHIEIVVRQMTARVLILEGYDTGLLSGELIQRNLLEKVNKKLLEEGVIPATYEPVILGITKSVLQSESFLLAASFQQVSRVLVRSALAKKTDFLRGLHENLLVGQVIPAGTGTISFKSSEPEEQPSGPGLPNSEETPLVPEVLEEGVIIDITLSTDESASPDESQSPESNSP